MHDFYKPGIDDVDSDSSIDMLLEDAANLVDEMDDLEPGPEPEPEYSPNVSENRVNEDEDDEDYRPSDTDSDDSDESLYSNSEQLGSNTRGPGQSTENNNGGNVENGVESDEEEDETIRAIKAAIKKPRTQPPEIKIDDFVTDISFHPDEDILAIGTIIGDVLLYKYANEGNTLVKTLEVHTKACRDIEFSEDGKSLLSASKDKSIMITDVETEKLKKFYVKAHESAIYKLYVIDENLFATGDDSGVVKLWDIRQNSFVFSVREVEDYISAMLTNDAKKLLLVTSGDGYLTTINIGARKLYVQSEPYDEELTCMGIYRNESKVIVGTSKNRLYSFNWGEFGYHSDMFPGMKTPISAMLPLTDRIGCIGGEEGILRACHIAPFKNLGIVGQHNMPIECMDINHSGEFIASSSHNNDVRFWNIKYFEDFGDIKYNEKHNSYKEKRHNLPSSKFSNASEFFADLANNSE